MAPDLAIRANAGRYSLLRGFCRANCRKRSKSQVSRHCTRSLTCVSLWNDICHVNAESSRRDHTLPINWHRAARGGDIKDVVISLRMVLQLEQVRCRPE